MQAAKILVVDDNDTNREILSHMLGLTGYQVSTEAEGEAAIRHVKNNNVDLILMDVCMPGVDGMMACQILKHDPATRLIPIVLLTGLSSVDDRIQAFEAGADDFISKPFHRVELLTRVRSLLSAKRFTDELENASSILQTMAQMVERRDQYTSDHCQSVSDNAIKVGMALGLPRTDLDTLRLGGLLHDLGKIGVPDAILHKPGRLDEAEMAVIRTHCQVGEELVAPLHSLNKVRPLIRHHHERLDGSGYPDGLKGAQIPILVRILSVVDVFAALSSRRSYKDAFSMERSLEILKEECDKGWWDKVVVDALIESQSWPAVGQDIMQMAIA
jgi:putative two-component system response regulator